MKSYEIWEWEGDAAAREWLMAWLDQYPFLGAEETQHTVRAYVDPSCPVQNFSLPTALRKRLRWKGKATLSGQNWNRKWEANFPPVSIGKQLLIYAPFHHISTRTHRHAICIYPAMAFGTGHHPSTRLVLKLMPSLPLKDAVVIDWGAGTGILSIYAEKLGARQIWAVENYPWALNNTYHNIRLNQCRRICPVSEQDLHQLPIADVILANIERNTLCQLMPQFAHHLRTAGILMISGILGQDAEQMIQAANRHGLHLTEQHSDKEWTALTFCQTAAP